MIQLSKRRRPSEGGYACGEETRLRLIQAAIPLFGRLGFDGVSTREIAAEAGVNPPALQYYFDSKEGLYRACAEYMTEQTSLAMDPVLLQAELALREEVEVAALISAYCDIMEGIADLLFCHPDASSWSPLLAREQAGFGLNIAFPLARQRFLDRLHGVCSQIVGRITGRPAESPQTKLRMLTINGQLTAFHFGRSGTLASFGWSEISPEQALFIKSVVIDQTRVLLKAVHREAQGGPMTALSGPKVEA